MEKDQKFLKEVVSMLVDHPKDLKISREVDERGVLLTVDVNPEDLGMLIGKQGRNISALRHLVRMVGFQSKAFVNVKLNQPEKAQK
jgi:hypothetical protein